MSPALLPPPINTPIQNKQGQMPQVWKDQFVDTQRTITLSTAPADARYVVVTANPSLTQEENLGVLTAGHLSITVAGAVADVVSSATIPSTDLTGALPALDASALTGLNASALASGTVPDARIPNPLPAVSGANLSALNASALSTGTVAVARLPFVLDASTYTPTLTHSVNVAASTAYVCQYLRVGAVVTVSGQVDIDPTVGGDTQLGLSLPIASNLASATQCAGTAVAPAVAGQCAAILGDVTNDRAIVQWQAVDTANRAFYFTFSYLVI